MVTWVMVKFYLSLIFLKLGNNQSDDSKTNSVKLDKAKQDKMLKFNVFQLKEREIVRMDSTIRVNLL